MMMNDDDVCVCVYSILVGTQIDLREDEKTLKDLASLGKQPITEAEGKLKCKAIRGLKYMECSGKIDE